MAKNDTPLNAKGQKWFITINDKKEATTDQMEANFNRYLNVVSNFSLYQFVAGIKHDKDKYTIEDQEEDPEHIAGEPKRFHIHIFVEDTREQTKKALLGELIELLGIDKEQIGILKTENKFLLVQYLLHQNHPEKAQYEANSIITNDAEELAKRLAAKYQSPEEQKIQALNECVSMTELIGQIGLNEANKLRGLFKDIKAEQRSIMLRYWERLEVAFNDLMELIMDYNLTFENFEKLEDKIKAGRILQNAIKLYKELNKIE